MIVNLKKILMFTLIGSVYGCAGGIGYNMEERAYNFAKAEVKRLESYCSKNNLFEWHCNGITITLNQKVLIEQPFKNYQKLIKWDKFSDSIAMRVKKYKKNVYGLTLFFKPTFAQSHINCGKYLCIENFADYIFNLNKIEESVFKTSLNSFIERRFGFIVDYKEGLTYVNFGLLKRSEKKTNAQELDFSARGTRELLFKLDPDEVKHEIYITPYITSTKTNEHKYHNHKQPAILGERFWFSSVEECEQCV